MGDPVFSSMLETIYRLIIIYMSPLYTVVYKTSFFFIDYWSFVHLASGFLIVSAATRLGLRRPFLLLALILVSWEVVEIAFVYAAVHVFKPETIPDQFTDIIIGFMGGFMGGFFMKARKEGRNGKGAI
jgi:hypothetical protein